MNHQIDPVPKNDKNGQTAQNGQNGHADKANRMAKQFRAELSLFFSMKYEMERLDKKGLVTYFGSARAKPLIPPLTTRKKVLTKLLSFSPKSDAMAGNNSYAEAEDLACYLARKGYGAVTGGGPGIMEAVLNGTRKARHPLAIGVQTKKLADLEGPSKESSSQSQGFEISSMEARQLTMLANSRAVILFPGGFGTLDELIQTLTLMQLKQLKPVPIMLMGGRERWQGFFDWLEAGPVKGGMINEFGQKLLRENIYFPKTRSEVLAILNKTQVKPAPSDMWKMTYLFEDDLNKAFNALDRLKSPFVAFFGSGKLGPNNAYYESAYQMAQLVGKNDWQIYSDGGAGVMEGIMEAVHKGAADAGVVAVSSVDNNERVQKSDSEHLYVPMSLFSSRNHVAKEADAFVGFPGGFGTMNNLLKNAVAMQIEEMERRPILLMHPEFWGGAVNWMERKMLDTGSISQSDFDLLTLVPNHGKGHDMAIELIRQSLEQSKP